MKRWLAAVVLGAAVAAPAAGQEPPAEPEGWAYELASSLMSPYCPGRALSDCPSPQAETLRMWIIVQEAAGRPKAEVLDELYARFGDQIRAAPRPEGFGLAAYAIPAGAFVAGGLLIFFFLRRQTRAAAAPAAEAADTPGIDPELLRRVDEDLAR